MKTFMKNAFANANRWQIEMIPCGDRFEVLAFLKRVFEHA
jgi:hypothetical protein